MGKYVWPRDLKQATVWYLAVLRELNRGVSLDELLLEIADDRVPGTKPSRRALQRQFYYLTKQGLIQKSGNYKTATYQLTETGIERLETLSFRDAVVRASEPWDNRWRLVLFDIPETKSAARFHIRRLLKELGFQRLQLSAWIHPLPLLAHFKDIQAAYGIERDLLLLEIANYTPPADILKHFVHLDSQFQELYQKLSDRE